MYELRTSYLVLLLLLTALTVPERLEAQALRSYGIKAAFTSSDISYKIEDVRFRGASLEFNRRSGFNIALFAEWLDNPFLSVLTQVEYAQRGFAPGFYRLVSLPDNPEVGRFEDVGVETRIDYLSAFVPLKVRYPIGASLAPFALAGPRIDVLLGQYAETHEGTFGPERFEIRDLSRTGIGLSAGAGITFGGLGKLALTLEARYNLDLTDASSSRGVEVKHNAFDVWLGVAL